MADCKEGKIIDESGLPYEFQIFWKAASESKLRYFTNKES
jgi:hypothetical protein